MKRPVLVLTLALLSALAAGSIPKPPKDTKIFNINSRSLDYRVQGKTDEHRYGVELKENKQFHHTKTEEDGVRLGCYGHQQDGKRYSTHYVADGKGYRLVPHHGLITVYPKNGGDPRKASFVQSFSEDEIKSANIRYFFPDGCQSGVARNEMPTIPPILKKDEPAVEIPVTEAPETTTDIPTTVEPETTTLEAEATTFGEETTTFQSETTTLEEDTTTLEPDTTTLEPDTTTVPLTESVTHPVTQVIESETETTHLLTTTTAAPTENCFIRCCDDDKARIVLSPTKTGISKIVIPFDTELLNRCSVEEIIEITSEKDNVELLKKLLKFAQRYKL